jgi:16S rRNA (adenine1518-N6/adenine1519-N6)-dimethyltransferase
MKFPPLSKTWVQTQLTQLNIRVSPKLGQNFIFSASTIDKIVRLAQLNPSDHVLEIGGGLGSLSFQLAQTVRKLTVIEVDKRLGESLANTLTARPPFNVDVIIQDALKITALDPEVNKCVSNLPYSLAVPITLRYLETFLQIREFLVLMQKEEAQRLTAERGTKLYGPPAIKTQYFAQAQIVGQVSRNVFYPRPRVDSSLLRIVRTPVPSHFSGTETQQFFELVRLSFRHRRKTLFNNLKIALPEIASPLESALAELGIPLSTRAEALTLQQFLNLFASLSRKSAFAHWLTPVYFNANGLNSR